MHNLKLSWQAGTQAICMRLMQGTLSRGPLKWPSLQELQPTDAAGPSWCYSELHHDGRDSLPAFATHGPNCHAQLPPKVFGNLKGPGGFPSRLYQPELLQQCSTPSLQNIWVPATLELNSHSPEADDSRAVVSGAGAEKAATTHVFTLCQQHARCTNSCSSI